MKIPSPLPWPWFHFTAQPQPLPAEGLPAIPTLADDGPSLTFQISHHAGAAPPRTIPLKILRLPPNPSSPPRKLLILLHGMGLSIATFRAILPHLLPSHDVALVDYSGMSFPHLHIPRKSSGWTRGAKKIHDLAALVWQLADALHMDHADLGGSSLGGGMCLVAALLAPNRARRLVLSNPACYPQTLPRTYRYARIPLLGELFMAITKPQKFIGGVEYIGYVDKSRFDPALRSHYEAHIASRENRFRLMELMRALPGHATDLAAAAHVGQLKNLTSPTLITWGEQDPLLAPGSGQRLANDLPNATFQPYPNLAHLPHEEAPEIIGPAWSTFLNTD